MSTNREDVFAEESRSGAVAFRTKIIYFDRATIGGDVDEDPCVGLSAIFLAEGGMLGP